MMFRNYEFTVDKLYFRVARASVSILPDISQFYQDIIDGKWTWDYLMNVSKNVYNDKTGDGNSIDDILGFAAETATGMGASGIVYSTALEIVDTFLDTAFSEEEKHKRRIAKLED